MTVEQAAKLFREYSNDCRKLDTLVDVGLGYVKATSQRRHLVVV